MSLTQEAVSPRPSLGKDFLKKDDIPPLDITSWETATQGEHSTLASLNGDCLQLILKHLSLADSHHLGLCCRRLYFQWLAERKATQAVDIKIKIMPGDKDFIIKENSAIFKRNISSDARDPIERGCGSPVKVALFNAQLSTAKFDKFAATCVNLRHLEVAIEVAPTRFAALLTSLSTHLHQLTSLKLYHELFDTSFTQKTGSLPSTFWRDLAAMRHSTLQHLTLINSGNLSFLNLDQPCAVIPQLPILRQLVSFSLHLAVQPTVLYSIMRQLVLDSQSPGAHLAPGTGARFGLPLHCYSAKELVLHQPQLLPYFTHLEVEVALRRFIVELVEQKECLFRCLPAMCNLQAVYLTVGPSFLSLAAGDFPALLGLLASLPHLVELTIDCYRNGDFGQPGAWPQSALPVFARVRTLSLWYCTVAHADIVEQFQLARAFPALRSLDVRFDVDWCFSGTCEFGALNKGDKSRKKRPTYDSDFEPEMDVAQCQACGRELTRGLLKLVAAGERKAPDSASGKIALKVTFTSTFKIEPDSIDQHFKGKIDNIKSDHNNRPILWTSQIMARDTFLKKQF